MASPLTPHEKQIVGTIILRDSKVPTRPTWSGVTKISGGQQEGMPGAQRKEKGAGTVFIHLHDFLSQAYANC